MEKTYDPTAIEQDYYERWESNGYFEPSGEGEPYCIMIPPPNVTGSLHMGHAFQDTIMDALTRYHRMRGYNTLWQPGTDHAGIATQSVEERPEVVGDQLGAALSQRLEHHAQDSVSTNRGDGFAQSRDALLAANVGGVRKPRPLNPRLPHLVQRRIRQRASGRGGVADVSPFKTDGNRRCLAPPTKHTQRFVNQLVAA